MANNDPESVKEILQQFDELFDDIVIHEAKDDLVPTYPESLLHIAANGNKYFTAYQSHNRQFIEPSAKLVKWKGSTIEKVNNILLEQVFLGNQIVSDKGKSKRTYNRPTSSVLFSWSSTDEYIERRKKELQNKRKQAGYTSIEKVEDESPNTNEHLNTLKKVGIKLPSDNIIKRLHYVIDNEANKFIHERIQEIKSHHNQQISEMISERKRKDHEMHLQRLKQKEDESEREMRLVLEKDDKRGFLGIFNFNTDSRDHNRDVHSSDDISDKKKFSFLPSLFSSDKGSRTSLPGSQPVSGETQTLSFQIASDDIDLVFKVPSNPNYSDDEFSEFTSSPPPQPQVLSGQQQILLGHKLMPMKEPEPLINLGE